MTEEEKRVPFRLVAVTDVHQDCTCTYQVVFDMQMTVREFIHTVLNDIRDEWGTIQIQKNGTADLFYYSDCRMDYRHGEVEWNGIGEDIMDKEIKWAYSNGGWSAMDYYLILC